MISIDINSIILSKLQNDSEAKKEIATLLKRELVKYSKKRWNNRRIKIQKDLLQCLLPKLLEIITIEEEILKYLDLSEVSFAGIDVTYTNFKDSNANIDPQTVKDQTLYKTNLQNCNMAGEDFWDVLIEEANLENTNAQIDPQLIKNKSLYNTNVKGCTFINRSSSDPMKREPADFTGVDIRFANLENTNAQIDPQLIKNKTLHYTNAKGCTFINLSSLDSIKREPADFTGINIEYANLENTNAQIDPQLIYKKSLYHTNLKGLDLSHANFYGVDIWGANLEATGAIINPHTVDAKIIYGTNLNYCTLIDDGKLKEINYDKDTSLKHVKFSTVEPHNIYQDIAEYIQTTCSPITTLKKTLNKVFKR